MELPGIWEYERWNHPLFIRIYKDWTTRTYFIFQNQHYLFCKLPWDLLAGDKNRTDKAYLEEDGRRAVGGRIIIIYFDCEDIWQID